MIADHVQQHPDVVARVGYVFQWKITSPESTWLLDLKNGAGSVTAASGPADCTLEIAERDFADMTAGKSDAMKLFTTGKLKISGNVMASQKLEFLRKLDPARGAAVVAKLRGAAPAASAGSAAQTSPGEAPAAAAAAAAPRAAAVFAALAKRVAAQPNLAQELGAAVQFVITAPAAEWMVDLHGAVPRIEPGRLPAPATTITLADAELAALASGAVTAQQLYQRGTLRVDGDVSSAHRLGLLKGLL
ncbi:MAG: SCP2 sterol-binding domain-containing protein [Myxococcales bacterium]|nr:SCP2 sterol-binding domain-containing protein [Myxococcales bacterium]